VVNSPETPAPEVNWTIIPFYDEKYIKFNYASNDSNVFGMFDISIIEKACLNKEIYHAKTETETYLL